jgi:hypothetical protein
MYKFDPIIEQRSSSLKWVSWLNGQISLNVLTPKKIINFGQSRPSATTTSVGLLVLYSPIVNRRGVQVLQPETYPHLRIIIFLPSSGAGLEDKMPAASMVSIWSMVTFRATNDPKVTFLGVLVGHSAKKPAPKYIRTLSLHIMLRDLSELFGPGHFVGLGLRLKSEIRTRARDFPTP